MGTKLRYRLAEQAELEAKAQAAARATEVARLEARGTPPPPDAQLLGSWRLVETEIIADSAETTREGHLDVVLIFDVLAPGGEIRGELRARQGTFKEGPDAGQASRALSVYSIEARIIRAGRLRARLLPLDKPLRRGLRAYFPLPMLIEADWVDHVMTGESRNDFGDHKRFKAVRLDEGKDA